MAEESKKHDHKEKDFGEGIEVIKEKANEEKDIEINFGKIFSFLNKSDKKEQTGHKTSPEHKPEEKKEEELDLGKIASGIKGIFKEKKEASETQGQKPDDEASLNAKAAIGFLTKRGALILLIAGILFSMGLTAHVRQQVGGLPFANQWAENNIYNLVQNDIQNAINSQYPKLPDARKSQMLTEQMKKARKTKSYQFQTGQYQGKTISIENEVKGTANVIKEFYKDNEGKTYSPDIDPYYWHRYAKNIVENGHIWDELKNGIPWDNRQLAPIGRPILPEDTSFPYFIAYLYKAARIFNPSATLWGVQTTLYPALITAITALLVFLICRKIAGNIGGFFGSLMAGLHSAYVNRTIHGDNDSAVILLAILTLWLFVEAIYARKMIWKPTLAAAAGLSAAMFSITWGGWWFILLFILSATTATVAAGAIHGAVQSAAKGQKPAEIAKAAVMSALTGHTGKHFTIPAAIFVLFTGFFVGIFTGFERVISVPMLALGVTKLKAAVLTQSYWPNVLTTVAELNAGNFNQIVSQIKPGIFGIAAASFAALTTYASIIIALPFAASKNRDNRIMPAAIAASATATAIGLAAALLQKMTESLPTSFWLWTLIIAAASASAAAAAIITLSDKIRQDDTGMLYSVFFAVLIAVWFISTIYASTKGVRFVLLLAPAVGMGFGISLGLINKLAGWLNENFLKVNKTALALAIFAILALSTYSTDIKQDAYKIAKNDVPIINDAWHNSLTAIKEDSNETAIITSWWDFGHHFKEITDRRVTFDGTTQQGPQAHWVGKFFMTKDETAAAGMLRMLDCGSNTAWDSVNSVKNDFAGSVKILYRATAIPSKTEAERILTNEYGMSPSQAANVTKNTHCTPPEGYVIASDDMIGKSGVWGHFGSWDFERAIIYQTLRGMSEKEAVAEIKKMFNYSDERAKATYSEAKKIRDDNTANSWIAPWPSYLNAVSSCGKQDDIVGCTPFTIELGGGRKIALQLIVNMTANEAFYLTPENARAQPPSYVTMKNETLEEYKYENATIAITPILIPQGDGYAATYGDPAIAAGMYTRMFFFGGKGLKHFKLLKHESGLTGTNIYVYKADWDSLE